MTQVVLAGAALGGVDIGDFDVSSIRNGTRTLVSPNEIRVTTTDGWVYTFTGSGFAQSGSAITAGTVTGLSATANGAAYFTMTGASASAQTMFDAVTNGQTDTFLTALLSGHDTITSSVSNGHVWTGSSGDDTFTGGLGIDTFNGGPGTDTASYTDARGNYAITVSGGFVQVAGKAGSTGGLDFHKDVERLVFSNATLDLSKTDAAFVTSATRVLRGAPTTQDLELNLANSLVTRAVAVEGLVDLADATSSVATLAYQFFTGAAPSAAGMDYLIQAGGPNPNNLNSAYYQSFNLENRYINFAVNLGREGEGKTAFQTGYGSLSLFEATKKAYGVIFGATPSDAKVTALLAGGRDLYFEGYGKDGLNGQGTKAAMVGWLLAEATKADLGVYALSNEAFLTDVANNNAAFAVNIIGTYSRPEYVYDPG